jgi:CRP-like cAMP-binding protein
VPSSEEGTKTRASAHGDQPREFKNRLLASLSHEAASTLRPHLQPMALTRGAVLCEADDCKRRVCFIESGVAALVTEYLAPVAVASVGREGAVGGPTLLLGGGIAFSRYRMLTSGSVLAMEVPRFRIAMQENPKLRGLCESYSQAFFVQVLGNVACCRRHTAKQRCARWLLMCDDQIQDGTLELAQDSLAAILGLPQLVAETIASRLHKAGLIRLREGLITIVDRGKLQAAACGCYRKLHDRYYRRLLAD